MKDWEDEFEMRLVALAGMVPNFVLTPQMIEMYSRLLEPLGYQNLCYALEKVMMERHARDHFPSIRDLKEMLEPALDPKQEAILLANKIIERVSMDGYTNLERAKERIGEKGWRAVVSFGGWLRLCETLDGKNMNSVRAQLRELIEAQGKEAWVNQLEHKGSAQLEDKRGEG